MDSIKGPGAQAEQRDLESEAPSASLRPRSVLSPLGLHQVRQRAQALPGVSLLLARVPLLLGLALGVTCVLLVSPLLSSSPLDSASAPVHLLSPSQTQHSQSHSQAQHSSSCSGPSWRTPHTEAEAGEAGAGPSSVPAALEAHWALAEEALRGSVQADTLALQASHSAAAAAAARLRRHARSSSSSPDNNDNPQAQSSSSPDNNNNPQPDSSPDNNNYNPQGTGAPRCNSSAHAVVDPRALVAALVRCRQNLELYDAIQARLHSSLGCCSCAPQASTGPSGPGPNRVGTQPHAGPTLAPPSVGCQCPWLVSQRQSVLVALQRECGLTRGQVEARALQRTRETQIKQRCAGGGGQHRQGPCGVLEGTPGAELLRQAGIHVSYEGTRGIMRVDEPWKAKAADPDAQRRPQLWSAWPLWAQGTFFSTQAEESLMPTKTAVDSAAEGTSGAVWPAERGPMASIGQGSGRQEEDAAARGGSQELWNSPIIGRGEPAWPYALHRNSSGSGLWNWPAHRKRTKAEPFQLLPLRTTQPDHALASAALTAAEQALQEDWKLMGRACRGCVAKEDALDVSFMLQYWQQPRILNDTVESYSRCVAGLGPKERESPKALEGVRAELLVNVDQPGEADLWLHHWLLLNRREVPGATEGHKSHKRSQESAVDFLMVVFQHNIHEARGYNRLASAAEGDMIMVVQDDDLAPDDCDWVPRLLDVFERRPRVGCIGTNTFVKNAGAQSPIWIGIRRQDACEFDLDPVTGYLGTYAQLVDIGPMVFQRCVWMELGGFNEAWNHLGEPLIITDWEFSQRIWLAGYRVMAHQAESESLFKRTVGEHSTLMPASISVAKRVMVWGPALVLFDELFEETHTPVYKELIRSWRLHVPGVPWL